MRNRNIAIVVAFGLMLGIGCGGGSSSSTPSSTTSTTATLTPGTAVKATIAAGSASALNLNFPATAVSVATTATVTEVAEGSLPQPIKSMAKSIQICSGNTYIAAFSISLSTSSITVFNVPVTLDGTVATTIAAGTTYNVAMLSGSTWNDVGTVTVGASGAFAGNLPSLALPGIMAPGTYVIYLPAAGCSTAVSNLGIALVANDGAGSTQGLQVIRLYDASGNVLATPTLTMLAYSGAGDIDGQALTPDGSQGILVDGGNTVRFFSAVQTGVPIASTTTLDISAYGGDGDSVAIMPTGDEAVVSGDSSTQLLIVTGIVAGTPVANGTITIPGARDGVVISADGKVLMARGPTGLTGFVITGSSSPHTYTQVIDVPTAGNPGFMEDGRDGMAISPTDSNRAVIIGSSTATNTITLVTALQTSPTAASPVTLTGVTTVYSVSITPDGKKAIVGTDAGIIMLSGVDTGTLTQVGTLYAPTYAGASGNVTLGVVSTLGITLDGLNVVVCDQTNSALLVIPFSASTANGFAAAPTGILNSIAVPGNDQMVLH